MDVRSMIRQVTPPVLYSLVRKARRRLSRRWHRQSVGGLWEQIGKLQFDFLVSQGLKPEHKLLDIGCGSMRGGIYFVKYLEPDLYFGVDNDEHRLKAGLRYELTQNLVQERRPTLLQKDNFDFSSFGTKFDYALAQSLFPHLPLNSIIRCILNVDKALVQNGRFYATFFENPHGKIHLDPVFRKPGEPQTYMDENPFHYDIDTFKWICQGTGLEATYIGDWGHPRGQKMVLFRKVR